MWVNAQREPLTNQMGFKLSPVWNIILFSLVSQNELY
jgi:hypothetical protein